MEETASERRDLFAEEKQRRRRNGGYGGMEEKEKRSEVKFRDKSEKWMGHAWEVN